MRTPSVAFDDLRPGMVAAIGVPWDGSSHPTGLTRFGPTALRETSAYFGSHFSANMKAAMDIDRRRVMDRGLMSGRLVDLGDLCIEGTDPLSAEALIESATAAVVSRGAIPLLLGGDLDLVPPALAGLARTDDACDRETGALWVQVGGPRTRGTFARFEAYPVARLACNESSTPLQQTTVGPAEGLVLDATLLQKEASKSLASKIRSVTQGRPVFVSIDLSAWAAHWHGMHGQAPLQGLSLRDIRQVLVGVSQGPISGIAITGLDASRTGLSTVKTGQRMILTALLDVLYTCLAAQPVVEDDLLKGAA